jgi:hypothetical protein
MLKAHSWGRTCVLRSAWPDEFCENRPNCGPNHFCQNYLFQHFYRDKSATLGAYPWYKLCINFDKIGLGYNLGHLFINSSGHPCCDVNSREKVHNGTQKKLIFLGKYILERQNVPPPFQVYLQVRMCTSWLILEFLCL